MSAKINKILRQYAMLRFPDGSTAYDREYKDENIIDLKRKGDKIWKRKKKSRELDGFAKFYKALKAEYKKGLFTIDEIKKELADARTGTEKKPD